MTPQEDGDQQGLGVTTGELWAVLQVALESHFGRPCGLTTVQRQPFAFRTSFPIEALDIGLDDGRTLQMLLKDLSWQSLTDFSRQFKVPFLHDPMREIEVYRDLLVRAGCGTPVCYGTVADPPSNRHWLFLERVSGLELHFEGELSVWQAAAAWLGAFHARFAGLAAPPSDRLIRYDEAYYAVWPTRALAFAAPEVRPAVARLLRRYGQISETLQTLPRTVLHGEFYPTNVLIQRTTAGLRVCPIDWEMAAWGPGLIDLAALGTGWPDAARASMSDAYQAGWATAGKPLLAPAAFQAALDCCRLHLAVKWLGWSREPTPSAETAHEWLTEGQDAFARLSENSSCLFD